jgi:hypothetical protein
VPDESRGELLRARRGSAELQPERAVARIEDQLIAEERAAAALEQREVE